MRVVFQQTVLLLYLLYSLLMCMIFNCRDLQDYNIGLLGLWAYKILVIAASIFLGYRCKTVRPMLSHRLSVLSVTFVYYCGQTVGLIKMSLGTEVGLGPGATLS